MGGREREREKKRQREGETEGGRDIEREKETDRQTGRQAETERERIPPHAVSTDRRWNKAVSGLLCRRQPASITGPI